MSQFMFCFLSPQISQIYTDFLASGLICANLRNPRYALKASQDKLRIRKNSLVSNAEFRPNPVHYS